MRKLISKAACVLALLCVAGVAQATSIFTEGFDTYTSGATLQGNGGWSLLYNTSSPYINHDFTVTTAQHEAGTKSLQTPAGSWTNSFTGLPEFLIDQVSIGPDAVGAQQLVEYSYYVRFSSAFLADTTKAPSVSFQVNDGTSLVFDSYMSATMTGTADKVQIEGAVGYTNLSDNLVINKTDFTETVNSTTWYELSAVVNNDSGVADFYFGNTLIGATTLPAGTIPNIASADVGYSGGASGDTAYLDTLSVSIVSAPEPATITLLGIGLVGLLGRMRRK